jgi:hypothetical protein
MTDAALEQQSLAGSGSPKTGGCFRMIKVASGGTAARVEARRMVTEKLESGLALQVMA